MSAWLPIETAPKDGSWFVICRAGEPDSLEAGCYDPLIHHKYVEAGAGLYRREDRVSYEWQGFNNFHRATHWLSVPPIPEVSA